MRMLRLMHSRTPIVRLTFWITTLDPSFPFAANRILLSSECIKNWEKQKPFKTNQHMGPPVSQLPNWMWMLLLSASQEQMALVVF
ncbi:conserved hypothetical protein [Ricinus communis]|uniref:Uncharacterized protein n=1 Tax=Ricinus communis TaxID=3988 RepID=B9T5U5_RICCO|nr:conserved hypothetical protein [Ricinus communis]